MNNITIGDVAVNNITSFTGLVDAKIEYLTGCTQFRLQPRDLKDGKIQEAVWFDENRLTVVQKSAVECFRTENGGPPPVIPARQYPR